MLIHFGPRADKQQCIHYIYAHVSANGSAEIASFSLGVIGESSENSTWRNPKQQKWSWKLHFTNWLTKRCKWGSPNKALQSFPKQPTKNAVLHSWKRRWHALRRCAISTPAQLRVKIWWLAKHGKTVKPCKTGMLLSTGWSVSVLTSIGVHVGSCAEHDEKDQNPNGTSNHMEFWNEVKGLGQKYKETEENWCWRLKTRSCHSCPPSSSNPSRATSYPTIEQP